MIDLHLHSIYSDGLDAPSQLIEYAMELKLKAIALTDHDTIDGLNEFLTYRAKKDIIVIPGIEISIKHKPDREIEDVHIVGLNIDHNSAKLINILDKQTKGRIEQKKQICKKLKEKCGYNISFEDVKALAGANSVGKPHIVEIMKRNNPDKVKGKSENDLYKMISVGGCAYIFREFRLNLEEAVALINSAGGIPILAHAGIYKVTNRTNFVEFCVDAGIKGIEIEYTYAKNRPFVNTDKAEWAQKFRPDFYRNLAEKFNLIKSGGSDYHGGKKGIFMGETNVPDNYLKNFI